MKIRNSQANLFVQMYSALIKPSGEKFSVITDEFLNAYITLLEMTKNSLKWIICYCRHDRSSPEITCNEWLEGPPHCYQPGEISPRTYFGSSSVLLRF